MPEMCQEQQKLDLSLNRAQQIFHSFTRDLEKKRIHEIVIRRASKKYDLKTMKVNDVTPIRARRMFDAIKNKYDNKMTVENNWFENQRRIFIWSLICYLHQQSLQIPQMKPENFEFMKSIFPGKDLGLIKFQSYSLIKKSNRNKGWSEKEDEMLRKIIKYLLQNVRKCLQNQESIPWSSVSKEFFIQLNEQFFRNAKQCRERWMNHLDPNKMKGKWDAEQDKNILQEVLNNGKKWSKIALKLEGQRSQHTVKNRYKSLIHKKQRTLKKAIKQEQIIKMILNDLKNGCGEPDQGRQQSFSVSQIEIKEINGEIENDEQISLRQKDGLNMNENKSKKQKKNKALPIEGFKKLKGAQRDSEKIYENQEFQSKQEFIKQDEPKDDFLEIIGEGQDPENIGMMDRIVQNANTPTADNRFSYMFDPRSPNFILSPFRPQGWTPTIFFMEDHQGQISPQVGFGNFSSKCMNDFGKFIEGDQE